MALKETRRAPGAPFLELHDIRHYDTLLTRNDKGVRTTTPCCAHDRVASPRFFSARSRKAL